MYIYLFLEIILLGLLFITYTGLHLFLMSLKRIKTKKVRLTLLNKIISHLNRISKLNARKRFPYIRINNDGAMEIIIVGESWGSAESTIM